MSPTMSMRDAAQVAARREQQRTRRFVEDVRAREAARERQRQEELRRNYRDLMPPMSRLEQELLDDPRRACLGEDVETFYPVGGPTAKHGADKAKAICSTCPVRAMCLQVALERQDQFAVLGGMTWQERKELRQERKELRRRRMS